MARVFSSSDCRPCYSLTSRLRLPFHGRYFRAMSPERGESVSNPAKGKTQKLHKKSKNIFGLVHNVGASLDRAVPCSTFVFGLSHLG